MNMNFNKYENYIRVGHKADGSDLENFPTPSALGTTLHDLDKDPFTDLEGYTHRNRVRNDVLDIEISYEVLSDDDIAYILNRIRRKENEKDIICMCNEKRGKINCEKIKITKNK